jgi:hypothetical protein
MSRVDAIEEKKENEQRQRVPCNIWDRAVAMHNANGANIADVASYLRLSGDIG